MSATCPRIPYFSSSTLLTMISWSPKRWLEKYQTSKIPLGKDYVSTFQNLTITEFTVCLTRRPLDKRTTTQYYRTRPSKNFETVNLEIPNSKSLKTQTLSKLGIRYSDDLMILFVWSNTTALKDGSFEFYFFTFDFIN